MNNTAQADRGPSVRTVFHTTELLELILLQLPLVAIRDLLCVQRVSRAFRHTIQGSTKLQKRLFFIPSSTVPVEEDQGDGEEYLWAFNPLLAPSPHNKVITYFKCGDVYIGLSRVPFHFLHVDQHALDLDKAEERGIPGMKFEVQNVKREIGAGDRLARSGCWESMYFTQPPQNVRVDMISEPWHGFGFQTKTPTTMGELMKRAIKLAKLHLTEDAW